jgi:hypothetical protein
MGNPNCEDFFEGDLTPLSKFERVALLIGDLRPDPELRHCFVKGKPLCQLVGEPNPGGLLAEVNCITCRELWHFKVSPRSYRERIGYTSRSIFTRYFDMLGCSCLECERLTPVFWESNV